MKIIIHKHIRLHLCLLESTMCYGLSSAPHISHHPPLLSRARPYLLLLPLNTGSYPAVQVGLKFTDLLPLQFWDYKWVTAIPSSTSFSSKGVKPVQVSPVPKDPANDQHSVNVCRMNTWTVKRKGSHWRTKAFATRFPSAEPVCADKRRPGATLTQGQLSVREGKSRQGAASQRCDLKEV